MNTQDSLDRRPTIEERVAYLEGKLGVRPPWWPWSENPIRKTVVERICYLEGLFGTMPARKDES